MGTPGSATWNAILDSSEEILKEEGYGALTSRRVAEHMGIKQRLIYYYFKTMDDLIVNTFRRLAERDLQRLRRTLNSPRPLHELWHICIHTADARLILEFMALANRVDDLRAEVVAFIEESRRIQIAALQEGKTGAADHLLPSAAIALFANSLGLLLIREAELGVTMGHIEVAAVIGQFLAAAEPTPKGKTANKRSSAKPK